MALSTKLETSGKNLPVLCRECTKLCKYSLDHTESPTAIGNHKRVREGHNTVRDFLQYYSMLAPGSEQTAG